jgi:chemotaxis protein methyltransferase CheR
VTGALAQIATLLREESGVLIGEHQHAALSTAIVRTGLASNAAEFAQIARDPAQRRQALAALIDEVTVKETSFMRDRRQLAAIPWQALHESAQAAGDGIVRVWSAACATGEEVYTLAILACESFGTNDPPVHIVGTDISGLALARANEGAYRERAVRELDAPLRDRYFTHDDATWTVNEIPRRFVEFAFHNLYRDPIPPLGSRRLDLIVCRNVLIYFDGETIERVVEQLERALRAGGTLVLGAADALSGSARRLAASTRTAPARERREPRTLRRPLGRVPQRRREDHIATALQAADHGRAEEALAQADAILAKDPLDAEAHYIRGLVELERGDARAAVASLRRALYVDPSFALAAFKLGRANEAAGDKTAALRAYEQALRTIDPDDERHELLLEQVDLGDIAAACSARVEALRK